MDAKELRIGNLIEYKGSYVKIRAEDFAEFDKNLLDIAIPIPLNEDWLVKFGFKRRHKDAKWFELTYNERGTYMLFGLGNYHTEICLGGTTTAQGPTKHVHQLQNLYFALTGMELTIKEHETTN
jgi:hypothetical protein